jgi:hypothetical protein
MLTVNSKSTTGRGHLTNIVTTLTRRVRQVVQRVRQVVHEIIQDKSREIEITRPSQSGLPFVKMQPYTDEEWDSLPHVILSGDGNWNPSVLDHSLTDGEQWYDTVSDFPDAMDGTPVDAEGNYRNLHVFDLFITDSILDNHIIPDLPWLYQAHEHQIIESQQDFTQLRPNFAWLPENVVKETFKNTTQYARIPMSTVLKKHYKSPFPALNAHRHEEALATNTVFSNVPGVDSGVTIAQLFVGLTSTVCDVYPLKTKKAFVNPL